MSSRRWVVLEPPTAGEKEKTVEARFVKDAFAPLAFFFLFFWLFWHRVWLGGIVVLALYLSFMMIGWWQGFGLLSSISQAGLALLVGLEGRNLVVSDRLKKGWRMASVIHADSRAEAELRYFKSNTGEARSDTQALDAKPESKTDLPWTARTA
ncbi:DUF2628 domain-containing protein [Fulvimarina sp. MAC8]|uniref:DUF2628 domain-containing protein n=1 Tax=Fulvimarina sp. MAC8 TaxID=3162874 RepID=UPI0032EAFFCD